jgi:hypothetical protein
LRVPVAERAAEVTYLKTKELFGPSKLRSPKRKVFLAYRFQAQTSTNFVKTIQRRLGATPGLDDIEFMTGKAPVGTDWAGSIIRRLEKATLFMVADVTDLRPEVLFELGIAFGLRRWVVPVIESSDAIPKCPAWLRWLNIASYDTAGFPRLLRELHEVAISRRSYRPTQLPGPTPYRIGVLGSSTWLSGEREKLRELAESRSFAIESLDDITPNNFKQAFKIAAQSTFLIICATSGTESSALVSFLAGIPVAQRSIRPDSNPLRRRVVLAREGTDVAIADGIVHTQELFTVVDNSSELMSEIELFFRAHSAWLRSGNPGFE